MGLLNRLYLNWQIKKLMIITVHPFLSSYELLCVWFDIRFFWGQILGGGGYTCYINFPGTHWSHGIYRSMLFLNNLTMYTLTCCFGVGILSSNAISLVIVSSSVYINHRNIASLNIQSSQVSSWKYTYMYVCVQVANSIYQ